MLLLLMLMLSRSSACILSITPLLLPPTKLQPFPNTTTAQPSLTRHIPCTYSREGGGWRKIGRMPDREHHAWQHLIIIISREPPSHTQCNDCLPVYITIMYMCTFWPSQQALASLHWVVWVCRGYTYIHDSNQCYCVIINCSFITCEVHNAITMIRVIVKIKKYHQKSRKVYCTLWWHPHNTNDAEKENVKILLQLLNRNVLRFHCQFF